MTSPMPGQPAAINQSGGLKEDGNSECSGTDLGKGLGDFARFPLEIRRMVWHHFVPEPPLKSGEPHPLSLPTSPSSALAILRVSRPIYHEVSDQLFHELQFHVCLDPAKDRWTAVHPKAQPWLFKSNEHPKNRVLKIRVIEPNVKEDPGQLCQLLESTIGLACSLCGHSPSLYGEERSYNSFDRVKSLIGELRCHGGSWKTRNLPPIRLYFHDRFEPAWRTDTGSNSFRKGVVGRVIALFKFVATLQLSKIEDDPAFEAHAEHTEVKALIEHLKLYPRRNKFRRWQDFLYGLLEHWLID
ncbi:MAG: hypothetical protein Q9194_006776 [Teloschistes cf. exilis]